VAASEDASLAIDEYWNKDITLYENQIFIRWSYKYYATITHLGVTHF
jgi:hypothetical protein